MKTRTLLLSGLLVSFAASPALGQDAYVGISAGQSDMDAAGLDEDTSWKVYGGYRFNEWGSAQIGWVDLGELDAAGGASVEADGFEISAVGRVPVTPNFDVFGKVGAFAWSTDVNGGLPVADDDDVDAMYGIGAEYKFANNLGVRLEWEQFADVGGADVDMISAGVSVDF